MTSSSNEFSEVQKALTFSDLAEVERVFGFRFPPAFREHYLSVNGGRPRRYLFHTEEDIRVLNDLLPIKYGTKENLFEDVYRDLKIEREVFPKHLVAFANDPGGDFFVSVCEKRMPAPSGSTMASTMSPIGLLSFSLRHYRCFFRN